MTVHRARVIVLAAVLVGISALVPIAHLHAEQPPELRPVAELRPLAEQGDADAQNDLGILHADGRGVRQDEAEAVRWFRLAANQRFGRALGNLGRMYHLGRGVAQDDVEAHKWYSLMVEHVGDTARDWAVEFFEELEDRMTPEQIAEAQRRARKWTPTPEP